jgi:hypothetical protein
MRAKFINTSVACVCIALMSCAIPGSVCAAELSIPGTSVSLDAPEGFTVSESFSGLENLEEGSSIVIAEFPPVAYAEMSQLFTDPVAARAGFAQQSISIDRMDTLTIAGKPVPFIAGRQQAGDVEVGKYIALFQGDNTVLVTFNVFDPVSLTAEEVDRVLASVKLAPPASMEEKVARLPFSFEVTAPFRLNDILLGSGALISTFEGTDPTGLKPVIIIAKAVNPLPAPLGLEQIAQSVLQRTGGFRTAVITTREDIEFGGGKGGYVEAIAGDRKIVQFIHIPADRVFLQLVAYGATEELDAVLPVVRMIAQSVALRD